jgi:hypothetical protein
MMFKKYFIVIVKMSAGLTVLVSRGDTDRHITGSPETTYFYSQYKKHSNFSVITHTQTLQQNPKAGNFSTVRIDKRGDLLSYINIVADDPVNGTQLISDWRTIIKKVDLYIGGSLIDSQDSEFSEGIAIDLLANTYSKTYPASLHGGVGSQSYFYPLRFWFAENWGSALPLIGLNFHDVELKIHWQDTLEDFTYIVDACYVLLDEQERNHLANSKLEMLIFQIQKNLPNFEKSQQLVFNHPVKWIASSNVTIDNVNNTLVSNINKVKLQVNGVDLTESKRSIPYYTSISCYYHSEYSASNTEQLFFFPFCLSAGKMQPTGTLNFSMVDSVKIHCDQAINTPIYALNLNVLRVHRGVGGLLYSD